MKKGHKYRFDYPIEFESLPSYSAHRGQVVTVLRRCTKSEAGDLWDNLDDGKGDRVVDRMFKVQADDGWIGDAWESELNELAPD